MEVLTKVVATACGCFHTNRRRLVAAGPRGFSDDSGHISRQHIPMMSALMSVWPTTDERLDTGATPGVAETRIYGGWGPRHPTKPLQDTPIP